MKKAIRILACVAVFVVTFTVTDCFSNRVQPTFVISSDNKEFREDVKYAIEIIGKSKSGDYLIKELQKSGKTIYIIEGEKSACGVDKDSLPLVEKGIPLGSTVILGDSDNSESPLFIILAHELQHALDFAQGKFNLDKKTYVKPGVSKLEASAMALENAMQKEFGYPVRERHDH